MKKLLSLILFIAVPPSALGETSIGTGLGIPYGTLGVNMSHTVSENVDLTVGLGTTILAGTAYSVGGRYYLKESDSGFRLTALYGTNAIITRREECTFCFLPDYEAFEGLTFGVGWGHRASASGWNIDLMLVATSEAFSRADELRSQGYEGDFRQGSRIALSAGYHWAL